jgi:hypothetical protein
MRSPRLLVDGACAPARGPDPLPLRVAEGALAGAEEAVDLKAEEVAELERRRRRDPVIVASATHVVRPPQRRESVYGHDTG